MENALAIANYFVRKSQDTGVELTPMKLVKLVYLSHGWYLGFNDQPLLPESVQAWQYGPVIPSVYHAYKKYGNEQITQVETDYENNYPRIKYIVTQSLLDEIWDVYGSCYTGLQLSTMTHEKGTPWDIVWNEKGGKDYNSVIIPNHLIRDYYKNQIEALKQENDEPNTN